MTRRRWYAIWLIAFMLGMGYGSLPGEARRQFTAQIQIALQTLGIWPYDGSYADGGVPTWSAAGNRFVSSAGGGGGPISASRFLGGDGSAAAPTYSFTNSTGTGLWWLNASSALVTSVSGGPVMTQTAGTTGLGASQAFGWSSNANPTAAGPDTILNREAAGHLFQRNLTNAQRQCLANTYASAVSWEAFCADWQTTANVAIVGTRTAATGTSRALRIVAQGANAADGYSMVEMTGGGPFFSMGLSAGAGTFTGGSSFAGNFTHLGRYSLSGSTGTQVAVAITPTINQTSTAAATDLLINRTQTAAGSGEQLFQDWQVSGLRRAALTSLGQIVLSYAQANGVTSTDGLTLENTSAATAGNQQMSRRIRWTGQGWKTNATAASQTVDFIAEVLPIQGAANPSASWRLRSQVNGGGYADRVTVSTDNVLSTGAVNAGVFYSVGGTMYGSGTAPTVTSAGTSPSVPNANGTFAFRINVGTGGTATTIVLAMPTATTGWNCWAENITATAANRANQRVVFQSSTTTAATLQNQTVSTGAALAFTASDIVAGMCNAF